MSTTESIATYAVRIRPELVGALTETFGAVVSRQAECLGVPADELRGAVAGETVTAHFIAQVLSCVPVDFGTAFEVVEL